MRPVTAPTIAPLTALAAARMTPDGTRFNVDVKVELSGGGGTEGSLSSAWPAERVNSTGSAKVPLEEVRDRGTVIRSLFASSSV